MLRRFQWYRRLRGGRWVQVPGLFTDRNWVHVSNSYVGRPILEDWRYNTMCQQVICMQRRIDSLEKDLGRQEVANAVLRDKLAVQEQIVKETAPQ